MDRELPNEREKNDSSQLTGLYRILQGENLEKPAKTKQLSSFCRI